jgi:ATP-dependent Clp protease adaptor protein ClpS
MEGAVVTSAAAIAEPVVASKPATKKSKKPKRQPRYNVILWNDEDHTFEYVMTMLLELFGHPLEKGFLLAQEVDSSGRAILLTTTKEHAELKRDQVHAYGKDNLIKDCAGSMWCSIEPVDEG